MSELMRLSYGLWRPAGTADDIFARAAALLSVCPPTSVIAGAAAARLHGLWIPSTLPDRFEVIVHPDIPNATRRGHDRCAEIRARRRILLTDETTVLHGLPIESESRTWVDLAEQLSLPDLVAAGDSVLRGSGSLSEMSTLVERATHRRGIVRARAALPTWTRGPDRVPRVTCATPSWRPDCPSRR